MIDVLRHPTLPVGVLLFVLGIGNWLVSHNKLLEYRHRLASAESIETVGALDDLPHLTPRTNAALLARLHRGPADYDRTAAKLDFYGVVRNGGRFFAFAGAALIVFAVFHSWSERRRKAVA
jgi:hypothetical protein